MMHGHVKIFHKCITWIHYLKLQAADSIKINTLIIVCVYAIEQVKRSNCILLTGINVFRLTDSMLSVTYSLGPAQRLTWALQVNMYIDVIFTKLFYLPMSKDVSHFTVWPNMPILIKNIFLETKSCLLLTPSNLMELFWAIVQIWFALLSFLRPSKFDSKCWSLTSIDASACHSNRTYLQDCNM